MRWNCYFKGNIVKYSMNNNNKLEIGEIVFYPQVGLGKIDDKIFEEVEGTKKEAYVISFIDNNSKVFVPVDSAENMNVRKLMNKEDISKVFDFLEHGQFKVEKDWKKRHKFHNELFISGLPENLALILKNLCWIDKKKGLTKNEKKFMEKVNYLLSSEIATILEKDVDNIKDEIKEKIEKSFGKSKK